MNPLRLLAATSACLLGGLFLPLASAEPMTPPAILQELRSLRELGTVLHVAAHPDDENTQLLTYFARGRGYRTAYLSITRGDGGQNLLSADFGERLGVARTQELLAARRLDGGQQFFTRALDFGFSKDVEETLDNWDRTAVVSDIVRIIRRFRPDVIITRFSPVAGRTHGHHTASAVLALEAFKLAGNPQAFPEHLADGLAAWQPKRILQNGGSDPGLQIEIGGDDPVLGEPFAQIAARSRAMHKTQGFGLFGAGAGGRGRTESFTLLDGEPATKDVFDGVETSWTRYPGGAEINRLIDDAISQFNPEQAAASVPALFAIRRRLLELGAQEIVVLPSVAPQRPEPPSAPQARDPLLDDKLAQLNRILQACLGLEVHTTTPAANVVPGETIGVHTEVRLTSEVPVTWTSVTHNRQTLERGQRLARNQSTRNETAWFVDPSFPLTQPYWLREQGTPGMAKVGDPTLIGLPDNPPTFPVAYTFMIGEESFTVVDEIMSVTAAHDGTERRRRLDVIPPVSLTFTTGVQVFAPGASKPAVVELTAARENARGTVRLDAPAGWAISPAEQPFALAQPGETAQFTFTLTAPDQPASTTVAASVEVDGRRFHHRRIEIDYEHIPFQLLQPPAVMTSVAMDLATRSRRIAYLPGAGDDTADNLAQMGYDVTLLTGDDLTAERLSAFDTVVLGVRVFNARTDVVARLPALFDWIAKGGTVIAQYNRPGRDLKTDQFAPYRLSVSTLRVTDERAPVTFLVPDHPVFTTPNRITAADFEGWVQELGVYYAEQWDESFTPLLAANDAGEQPLKGGLLVARHGQGHFVYTGLSFFRQLPAGVPGAYRLFANLVALGPDSGIE